MKPWAPVEGVFDRFSIIVENKPVLSSCCPVLGVRQADDMMEGGERKEDTFRECCRQQRADPREEILHPVMQRLRLRGRPKPWGIASLLIH